MYRKLLQTYTVFTLAVPQTNQIYIQLINKNKLKSIISLLRPNSVYIQSAFNLLLPSCTDDIPFTVPPFAFFPFPKYTVWKNLAKSTK